MSPVGFEPTISAGERPQTYALDSAATGTGELMMIVNNELARMWNERIMVQCEPIFPYLREGTEKIMRTSDHSRFVHFPFRAL